MDTADALEKIVAPVLSGAMGFAGAAFRFYLNIRDLKTTVARNAEKIVMLEQTIEAMKSGLRLEIDHLQSRIQDARSSFDESSHDFAKEAALAQFMAQQHQRWEQIQRTLGRIEGFLSMKGSR